MRPVLLIMSHLGCRDLVAALEKQWKERKPDRFLHLRFQTPATSTTMQNALPLLGVSAQPLLDFAADQIHSRRRDIFSGVSLRLGLIEMSMVKAPSFATNRFGPLAECT